MDAIPADNTVAPVEDINAIKGPTGLNNHFKPWRKEEKDSLYGYLRENKTFEDIASILGRTSTSIKYAADKIIVDMHKDGKTMNEITAEIPRFHGPYITAVLEANTAKEAAKNKRKEAREKKRKNAEEKKVTPLTITPEVSQVTTMQVDIRMITDIFVRLGEIQKSLEEIKAKLP
jgi:hypothetical protein